MDSFAEILEDLIFDSGLSLRQLQKLSGVTAVSYGKYLNGTYPSIEIAIKIANYFNCSLDYLFGLSKDKGNISAGTYDHSIFLERYQDILKKQNTSTWKISRRCGFDESAIRHWKRYGEKPSTRTLVPICEYLDVSMDYLVGRIDK